MANKVEKVAAWWASSVNPNKVSLTITSAAGLILFVSARFGLGLEGSDIQTLAQSFGSIATGIGAVLSAAAMAWGILRKVLVKMGWMDKEI